MLKGVHESLQGGGIGDVGLACPHLWQLLQLPSDLSQDLQHRTALSSSHHFKNRSHSRLSSFEMAIKGLHLNLKSE